MTSTANITRKQVHINQRIEHAANIFGLDFPMRLEPFIYALTDNLARDYNGGYWELYALSNGGFYMAPHAYIPFEVACENGFEGKLSADALGITVCLYAYSNLSFEPPSTFTKTCAQQYHWLREYMLAHAEATDILKAID